MNNSCLSIIYLGMSVFFFVPLIRVVPAAVRLLFALMSRAVKWPGPIVPARNPRTSLGRAQLGLSPEHLFPNFLFYALGLMGAFLFALLTFISLMPAMSPYIRNESSLMTLLFTGAVAVGGWYGITHTQYYLPQLTALLANLYSTAEPRQSDGSSAEAEYAIEHPLSNYRTSPPETGRAVQIFCEATRFYQNGDQRSALMLYEQAQKLDPQLHQHARETLEQLAVSAQPPEMGALYYWLGAHSEYLRDWRSAKTWYERAAVVYHQLGYTRRESRVHCNLGNVKMHLNDGTALDEFEHAIALNPKNGTAHLNIGRAYYSFCSDGDPRFDLALDAFANAIVADPFVYGPQVIASLREFGYTWQEDLEKITQRVESKRRGQ